LIDSAAAIRLDGSISTAAKGRSMPSPSEAQPDSSKEQETLQKAQARIVELEKELCLAKAEAQARLEHVEREKNMRIWAEAELKTARQEVARHQADKDDAQQKMQELAQQLSVESNRADRLQRLLAEMERSAREELAQARNRAAQAETEANQRVMPGGVVLASELAALLGAALASSDTSSRKRYR
jgi:multidrug efflux pump subunit AcrA (membrane-fusion protein)